MAVTGLHSLINIGDVEILARQWHRMARSARSRQASLAASGQTAAAATQGTIATQCELELSDALAQLSSRAGRTLALP